MRKSRYLAHEARKVADTMGGAKLEGVAVSKRLMLGL